VPIPAIGENLPIFPAMRIILNIGWARSANPRKRIKILREFDAEFPHVPRELGHGSKPGVTLPDHCEKNAGGFHNGLSP
jgi:hypothetical protein